MTLSKWCWNYLSQLAHSFWATLYKLILYTCKFGLIPQFYGWLNVWSVNSCIHEKIEWCLNFSKQGWGYLVKEYLDVNVFDSQKNMVNIFVLLICVSENSMRCHSSFDWEKMFNHYIAFQFSCEDRFVLSEKQSICSI